MKGGEGKDQLDSLRVSVAWRRAAMALGVWCASAYCSCSLRLLPLVLLLLCQVSERAGGVPACTAIAGCPCLHVQALRMPVAVTCTICACLWP